MPLAIHTTLAVLGLILCAGSPPASAPSATDTAPGTETLLPIYDQAAFQTDEDVAFAEGDPRRDPAHPRYTYTRHCTLKFVASRDQGQTWGRPVKLAGGPDDTATWGSLCVLKDGGVFGLIGLHGRVWCRPVRAGL